MNFEYARLQDCQAEISSIESRISEHKRVNKNLDKFIYEIQSMLESYGDHDQVWRPVLTAALNLMVKEYDEREKEVWRLRGIIGED